MKDQVEELSHLALKAFVLGLDEGEKELRSFEFDVDILYSSPESWCVCGPVFYNCSLNSFTSLTIVVSVEYFETKVLKILKKFCTSDKFAYLLHENSCAPCC